MSEYGRVIKLYGFTQSPYRLPSFLTPRVFSIEFIRQKLTVEIEHFLKYKKSINISEQDRGVLEQVVWILWELVGRNGISTLVFPLLVPGFLLHILMLKNIFP